jgi:alpha-1,3-rhamnosyl/mannosyltransferase
MLIRMRVLLNLLVASSRKTGIGHYASQLARCLAGPLGSDGLVAFPRPWLRRAWSACNHLRPYLERRRPRPASNGPATRSLSSRALGTLRGWGQALLTRQLAGFCACGHLDLYHEPNYVPLPTDLPTVVTIHDLSVVLRPEWHPADRVAHYERYFLPALRHCAHFLAVSDFSRQEAICTFGLAPARVTRTYLGSRPGLGPLPQEEVRRSLAQLGLPSQYLLYLGTVEPRKNILFLLQTYCSLPADFRRRWPLLLVGSWGWNTAAIREYLHDEGRHRGVLHLGYVADEHLGALYNGARALLYPSLYEGFGLPPVEMLSCGGAVLASTAGALAETVGEQADLLPADDRDGWRQAIRRVAEDDDWWRGLRRGAVERAAAYSWERCAAETVGAYRVACGRKHTPLAA